MQSLDPVLCDEARYQREQDRANARDTYQERVREDTYQEYMSAGSETSYLLETIENDPGGLYQELMAAMDMVLTDPCEAGRMLYEVRHRAAEKYAQQVADRAA